MSREQVMSKASGARDIALVACLGWMAFETIVLLGAVAAFHAPISGVAGVAGVVVSHVLRAAIVTLITSGAGLLS